MRFKLTPFEFQITYSTTEFEVLTSGPHTPPHIFMYKFTNILDPEVSKEAGCVGDLLKMGCPPSYKTKAVQLNFERRGLSKLQFAVVN